MIDTIQKYLHEDSGCIFDQLAGDELSDPTLDSLTATGYHRLMQWDDEPADETYADVPDYSDWEDLGGGRERAGSWMWWRSVW